MAAEETHNLTWHDLIRRAVKENPSFQMNQSRHSSHSTYLCRYHLIFCPKFRFNVLKDGVDETLKEILQKICDSYRYEVQAMEVRPDHIHLFLSAPQTAVPADIARTIKSISAIELFKAYPDLKHFYPEQFIKTDKWPETPLKNVFPAILLFTKQVSVNRSSFLYNISHTPKRKDFEQ